MTGTWNNLRTAQTALGLTTLLSLWVLWTRSDYGFSAPNGGPTEFASGVLLLGLFLLVTVVDVVLFLSSAVGRNPANFSIMAAFYGGIILILYGLATTDPLLVLGLTSTALGLSHVVRGSPAVPAKTVVGRRRLR